MSFGRDEPSTKYMLSPHLIVATKLSTVVLEDLGDVDIALGPHLEEKKCDRFRLKTIISLMIFSSKCGPSAMSTSPRSSSSSRYHEVNKKEVSSMSTVDQYIMFEQANHSIHCLRSSQACV